MGSQLFTYPNLILLFEGALVTIGLSLIGFVGGTLIGVIMVALRSVPGALGWPAKLLSIVYVDTLRRVPLLVILLFGFFGISLFGFEVSALSAAAFGVVAFAGAYMAENIRGGLEAIRKQQWEAGAALGLTGYQQLRIVVLPQALRVIIPPSVGFFVGLIKDTSVATIVGFVELTHAGVIIRYRIGESFTVFAAIMALYFLMCYPVARIGQHLERRLHARAKA